VLAATLEYVVLPYDLAAQVVTRSSYGRIGLITATAVQVQPGSHGCITLELVNHSDTPIRLMPGARIAQLVLFTVSGAQQPTPGKYRFSLEPEFAVAEPDDDVAILANVAMTAEARLGRRLANNDTSRAVLLDFTTQKTLEADLFQTTLEAEGIPSQREQVDADISDVSSEERVHRLVQGEAVSTLIVRAEIPHPALPNILVRFSRNAATAVELEHAGNTAEAQALASDSPRVAVIVGETRIEVPTGADLGGEAVRSVGHVIRRAVRKAPGFVDL